MVKEVYFRLQVVLLCVNFLAVSYVCITRQWLPKAQREDLTALQPQAQVHKPLFVL